MTAPRSLRSYEAEGLACHDAFMRAKAEQGASDHAAPYAPLVVAPTMDTPERRDRFRREWLAASRTRALTVLGPPMRCLMPADANPFPRFRPFRWLPC